jgi:glucokinase
MSEKHQALAIDVGGTNTRAKFGNTEKRQQVSSMNELKNFITGITKQKKPSRCAIGFGGPVVSRTEAYMTNWPDNSVIRIDDLYDWGLPEGSTLMLNDMEAGAYGVISMDEDDCICIHDSDNIDGDLLSSNKIMLAPGTGFGTIGIVSVRTTSGEILEDPVASEIQHSTAFPLDAIHGALIAWLSENKRAGSMPSWEEFVSGRGLVNIYDGLAGVSRITTADTPGTDDRAAWIAAKAVAGSDTGCEEALDMYYRCMGKVAQILALTYMPFGGIFISGESTIRNLSFIEKSGFLSELQDNPRLRPLLERFPVHAITQKDINLRGAQWTCKERIHLSHGFH